MKKHVRKRIFIEKLIKRIMVFSSVSIMVVLALIMFVIIQKGAPSMTWDMVSKVPGGGFYLGKEGGVLNAILGSLYLAIGGTVIAFIISLPLALYLETYLKNSVWGDRVRLVLDILWGVPSIVYGAFAFILMIYVGMRASLLAGIVTLALLEIPILARAMDEVFRRMPKELTLSALALGSTKSELGIKIIIPQMLPGIVTGVMLAFGRGIGDAASVLFTAGYTDRIPSSLMRPVASLPLAVFFQLGTPFPEVQNRAYASALILTLIVLTISLLSRLVIWRLGKYVIR
ncbi:MAG: phosphate ABC transporter permease [Chloroflexi bacterium HGW-Chloroflexi-10]|nr:MAG: phosphate ABC transporter permease [Chloroflexi bacterium HGW-Chloroflexi-10]